MFTLIYLNGKFNRPDKLLPFLQSNVGKNPTLQIDCITPFYGTKEELIRDLCKYLNSVDTQVLVSYIVTKNVSAELSNKGNMVYFLVVEVNVSERR